MSKEKVIQAAEAVKAFTGIHNCKDEGCGEKQKSPKIGLILGSGLGDYADSFENIQKISYGDIPHMKISAIKGHNGALVFGKKAGQQLVAMQGRLHYYEGFDLDDVAFPVRLMKELGVEILIITCAAGAVNPNFSVGNLMLITDHLNLFGPNVLRGQTSLEFGERFPSMNEVYDFKLRDLVKQSAAKISADSKAWLKEGVYCYFPGPSYETPSEIKAARLLGADAVGMSVVHEAVCAKQMNMKVLGISCISNMACGICESPPTHEEVLKTTAKAQMNFCKLLDSLIEAI